MAIAYPLLWLLPHSSSFHPLTLLAANLLHRGDFFLSPLLFIGERVSEDGLLLLLPPFQPFIASCGSWYFVYLLNSLLFLPQGRLVVLFTPLLSYLYAAFYPLLDQELFSLLRPADYLAFLFHHGISALSEAAFALIASLIATRIQYGRSWIQRRKIGQRLSSLPLMIMKWAQGWSK